MTRYTVVAVAILSLVTPKGSFALELIEFVGKERAQKLGIKIQSTPAGLNTVHIKLEAPIQGELKDYKRVKLEIRRGDKLLCSSTLKEEDSKPGQVVVSCLISSDQLDHVSLKIVTEVDLERYGHVIKVKDFVD